MANVSLNTLFFVKYGSDLELNKQIQSPDGIYFVSRNRNNNGVVARILPPEGIAPNPGNTISVPLGSSSALYAFLQEAPYYSGRDLAYLVPRVPMSKQVMLYYCMCIRANRYKFNWGRQANKSIGDIMIPSPADIPSWVDKTEIKDFYAYKNPFVDAMPLDLFSVLWHEFTYDDIFCLERGESYYRKYSKKGKIPYVSASETNNGVTGYVDVSNREGNLLVINYDGSVASAFYQAKPFFASEKVVTARLLGREWNPFLAMFVITVIQLEKARYNYGYKWSVEKRMRKSKIALPAVKRNEFDYIPDYDFMEAYIKRLKFSKGLQMHLQTK